MLFSSDKVVRVSSYDGQTVWGERNIPLFDVGNFLGGGAAGTVYECEYIKTKLKYALKILNPLGYKQLTPALLRKCSVLTKGKPLSDDNANLTKENVWWLMNSGTKQYISAYYNEKLNTLKELSLSQCVQVWNIEPVEIDYIDDDNPSTNSELQILSSGQRIFVPKLPPKYVEFIRKRSRIFREIKNMRKISNHINVIKLEGVLELVQESKCTIFLVMELANGGELFDRIRVDCGTREETAKFFFQQLLGGVKHCHDQGVCHRDLKPENLLLQDSADRGTILKIADFGFSARFAMAAGNDDNWSNNSHFHNDGSSYPTSGSPVRILKSIVGSPFYVAPEILQARGYDGSKADIWSLGVILYAMLAGNLPFGQDLSVCKRFKTFCKWVRQFNLKATQLWDNQDLDFPDWLFPSKFSISSKGLIVSMLHPDPICRISVADAMQHPLCSTPKVENDHQQIDSADMTTSQSTGENQAIDQSFSPPEAEVLDDTIILDTSADNNIEENDAVSDKRSDYDDQSGVFLMEEDSEEYSEHVLKGMACPSSSKSLQTSPASNSTPRQIPYSEYDQTSMESSRSLLSGANRILFKSYHSDVMCILESFYMGASFSGSLPTTKPPLAPHVILPNAMDDLITDSTLYDFDIDSHCKHSYSGSKANLDSLPPKGPLRRDRSDDSSIQPPSFNDAVKKSTRFITAVPAHEVLKQVENILLDCKISRIETPIGQIGQVELNWDTFRLEVWGNDTAAPSVCALQLFLLPPSSSFSSAPSTPSRNSEVFLGQSPSISLSIQQASSSYISSSFHVGSFHNQTVPAQDLYMVEFVRGQIEIFTFKRFYEWLRLKLSEIVKKDYAVKLFEQSTSPK